MSVETQHSRSFLNRLKRRITGKNKPPNTEELVGKTFNLQNKEFVQLDSYGLYVMPDDYIGHGIIVSRNYEPHVSNIIKSNLSLGDTFLDLGANMGYFTLLAASIVGDTGCVIAFEPSSQNQQLIFSSIDHNKYKNITVFPVGASDTAHVRKFINVGTNSGVVPLHSPDQRFYFYSQMIPADDLLSQEARIDLIKMDVESHEPFALKGLQKTINKFRPKIVTEFHPWALKLNNIEAPIEFLKQLEALSYKLSIIRDDSLGLVENLSPEEIMSYWAGLNNPTIQIELLALPQNVN